MTFAARDIRRLLELLSTELGEGGTRGEVYLVGGAVMCLAYGVRASTRDVDEIFSPTGEVRQAAARVGAKAGVDPHWLNDAVKGYMSAQGDFAPYLELEHLRVLVAQPEYLLAMKCLAMRLGAESHDEEDVRYLLRNLNVRSYDQALAIIGKYYPLERFPQKTLYALEELIPRGT
jgi:hypothetical protein